MLGKAVGGGGVRGEERVREKWERDIGWGGVRGEGGVMEGWGGGKGERFVNN